MNFKWICKHATAMPAGMGWVGLDLIRFEVLLSEHNKENGTRELQV